MENRNKPTITIEDVNNESTDLLEKTTKDNTFLKSNRINLILKEIEDSIDYLDFREYCEIEESEKLNRKHYLVSVIEELLKKANDKNLSLCRKDDSIFLYNSEFWEKLNEETFKDFLESVALKMGVYRFDAKHHLFKEELFKQFLSDAGLKEFNLTDDLTLINLKNGTFEITTSKHRLRDFKKEDFLLYQLPFSYNKNAKAPMFQKFLDKVLPDVELQNILAEYIACVFIKNKTIKIEKVLLLYGTGANGKSVVFDIIMALLGRKNVTNYSLQSLTAENSKSRINILNKLLNYSSEINGRLESNLFKAMASGEPIEVPVLYKQTIVASDYARLMFNCNELPKEVENTNAFFRRFLIIPFKVTIPESEQDKKLSNKIIENELSGVLNWVLKGLNRVLKNKGLTQSEIVKNEINKYRKQSDSVLMFIEENDLKPSGTNRINRTEVYSDYKSYCNDFGNRPLSAGKFYKRLEQNNFNQIKSDGIRYFEIE